MLEGFGVLGKEKENKREISEKFGIRKKKKKKEMEKYENLAGYGETAKVLVVGLTLPKVSSICAARSEKNHTREEKERKEQTKWRSEKEGVIDERGRQR